MLRGRPGGFRFNVDPVALMFETHSRIVFRSGTGACRPSLKCLWNALCVAITDSLFLKNVSTTKPRFSPDQPMALSEIGIVLTVAEGTWMRRGGEVKGKDANGGGILYSHARLTYVLAYDSTTLV